MSALKSASRNTQILVLWHRVSAQGIVPNPNKATAVLKLNEPINVSEIKRFMDMVNFY